MSSCAGEWGGYGARDWGAGVATQNCRPKRLQRWDKAQSWPYFLHLHITFADTSRECCAREKDYKSNIIPYTCQLY